MKKKKQNEGKKLESGGLPTPIAWHVGQDSIHFFFLFWERGRRGKINICNDIHPNPVKLKDLAEYDWFMMIGEPNEGKVMEIYIAMEVSNGSKIKDETIGK